MFEPLKIRSKKVFLRNTAAETGSLLYLTNVKDVLFDRKYPISNFD